MIEVSFLGDSITAGYGLHHQHSYPSVVGKLLYEAGAQVEIINEGVSGNTTEDGLRRISSVLKKRPAYLVIALGGNDMLRGIAPEKVKKNLELIIDAAESAQVKCILLGMKAGPFHGMDYMEKFNRLFDDLARDRKLPYLPFFIEEIALQAEFNQTDGVHPNSAGQRKVALRVAGFLQDQNIFKFSPVTEPSSTGSSVSKPSSVLDDLDFS